MASFIAFSRTDSWFTTNFIYDSFIYKSLLQCDNNQAAAFELEKARATQYLYLNKLSPGLASNLVNLMRGVAHTTLEAKDEVQTEHGTTLDPEGQRMYLESVSRLASQLDIWLAMRTGEHEGTKMPETESQ